MILVRAIAALEAYVKNIPGITGMRREAGSNDVHKISELVQQKTKEMSKLKKEVDKLAD